MRCFSSPGSLSAPMYLARNDPMGRVSPFGNPRIKTCSQFPEAYRRVLRPSSPFGAKASTKCPFALDRSAVTHRGKPRMRDNSVKIRLMSARTTGTGPPRVGQSIQRTETTRYSQCQRAGYAIQVLAYMQNRGSMPPRRPRFGATLNPQFLAHVRSDKRCCADWWR